MTSLYLSGAETVQSTPHNPKQALTTFQISLCITSRVLHLILVCLTLVPVTSFQQPFTHATLIFTTNQLPIMPIVAHT